MDQPRDNSDISSEMNSEGASEFNRDNSQDKWYEPAQSNKELESLLKSLEDDEDDVPLTYEKEESYQAVINQFRSEVEHYEQTAYLEDFHQVVQDDMLMIGSLSKQDMEAQEQKMKEEQLLMQQQELEREKEQKEKLAQLAESAKERVWEESKMLQKEKALRDEMLRKRELILSEQMKKAFQQSESQLRKALLTRKAEVKAFFGDLQLADNQFGGSKGKRWRVEWTKTPQPIQIKLISIRGIRDKVPAGRYVLMLSLYDRLGGHALRWSKLAGQQWGGATLPVHHDGKFTSSELKFQQSVFTVVPPQQSVQPGMILAFELFLLRGAISPTDKVVAWGCFPICDAQFEIIQGCYKLPMLRGFMDHRITKHSTIEHLVTTDIDHWLANLYIQIYRLPRYLAGQKEYEVELQFSSGLLSYPDRIINAEESIDGERIPDFEDQNLASTEDGRSTTNLSVNLDDKQTTVYFSSSSNLSAGKTASNEKLSSLRKRSTSSKTATSSHQASSLNEKEVTMISVEGQPGMFYKLHNKNPIEEYNATQSTTLIPQTPLINRKTVRPTLTHYEDLDRHTFSVQAPFSGKGRLKQHGHERAEYVARMFSSEMGFRQWVTYDFWITVLLLMVLWFCRLYIHYSGQWLFLQAIGIPVSSFVFFPYTVNLNYQADLLTTSEEIGVVLLGPIANIVIQVVLVLISWFSQFALGSFPLIFSKFIMTFSIWAVLDPIAILIVDSALGRYASTATQPIGDAFKLYWHFLRVEGSGVIGIPMTIFLYLLVIFVSSVILYLYFLKLHNNGRILDVFHRLHDEEEHFFVPHDLELSNQELSFIVKKAEQWRGSDGERRKVAVYDYIWEEEDAAGEEQSHEITTHIAIHTLHLDGLRELYRHFLRLPDGAIVEVFGELGSTNLSPDVKTALLKQSNVIENVMTPASSEINVNVPAIYQKELTNNFLKVSAAETRDRPQTNESVRTRATIRRNSSTSSADVIRFEAVPASSDA